MHPIILIPGFSASILTNKTTPTKQVLHRNVIDNRWLNVQPFSNARMRQWKKDMYYTVDRDVNGIIKGFKDYPLDIQPYRIGSTKGVRNLVPEFDLLHSNYQNTLDKLFHYKYFNSLCNHLEYNGWVDEKNLLGLPYDFRLMLDPVIRNNIYKDITKLLIKAKQKTKRPAVIVAHSLGGLLILLYLVENCDVHWAKEFIHSIVSVNVPYGGSPFTLKVVTSGSYYLPMFQEAFKEELMRNSGIIMCLPNEFGFSKKDVFYTTDDNRDITINNYNKINTLPFELWSTFMPQMIKNIRERSKEFNIPIHAIMGKDQMTELAYQSKSLDMLPYFTKYTDGDSTVPHQSLYAINDIYKKDNIITYSNSQMEHAGILKEKWFHEMVRDIAIDA